MGIVTLICSILFWAYIWNKWHRPRKPEQAKPDNRPIIYSEEQREAVYNEAVLRLLEDGQTPDIAQRVAQSLVQAYDRKAIRLPQSKSNSDRT